jgi:DNA polymerase III epsilon subunit family exonuclease
VPPATQLPLPLPAPQPGAERGDSLPDRLCALLARRGRPLEVGHVASQLLRLRGCPERLQRRLVAEIVEGDARLAWLGRDLVGLAPSAWSRAELATTTFCVVDLETTGGSPGYSKVTEIGAVRVEGGRVGERFATLVDPGRPIPAIVTELTGIDDEMVEGSPDIETALTGFVAFAGHDVLVAHNAPFDLRFLNYERRRLAGRYFTQPWLDTLTLARRLLNGQVPRHDLGTLALWADTTVRPMHRALPDAEATAEVLLALLELLDERGIDSLERAVAFAGAGGARHAHKLALADDLPAQPGVYLMRDREGGVLYVGKATNLRRRVRSYFGPGGRHGRLIGRALEELESLDHETCGSEFAALLREDRLIKELRPPCNRRGAGGGGAYLKLTLAEDSPRLYAVRAQLPDGAAYFGPVRSQRLARGAVTALRLLYGVEGPDTTRAADAVRRLLSGEPASLADLGRRLAVAVHEGRLAVEAGSPHCPAAALLGTLGGLARARRAQGSLAVLLEPGEEEGCVEAFFVAAGVVCHQAPLTAEWWREPARRGLAIVRRESRRPPRPPAVAVLDELGIVEGRLRERDGAGATLELAAGWTTESALAAIGRAVGALAGMLGSPCEPPPPSP